jgi:ubiquinone/menaquinone biosynthesis C-methylase UbiE
MGTYYDRYDYQKFWQDRYYENSSEEIALKSLLKKIDIPRKNLLDIGCGYGRNAHFYTDVWERVTLADPSRKNLAKAKIDLRKYKNIDYSLCQAESLPFVDSSFDTILCIRVLHHLPDPAPAIADFSRVLKPGGYLILEVANKLHFKALLISFFNGKWNELHSLRPIDRRTVKNITNGSIPFVNHHPQLIFNCLVKNGFSIQKVLSVSNFRSPLSKIPILNRVLILIEEVLQRPLGNYWFGPSLFILAIKI